MSIVPMDFGASTCGGTVVPGLAARSVGDIIEKPASSLKRVHSGVLDIVNLYPASHSRMSQDGEIVEVERRC